MTRRSSALVTTRSPVMGYVCAIVLIQCPPGDWHGGTALVASCRSAGIECSPG